MLNDAIVRILTNQLEIMRGVEAAAKIKDFTAPIEATQKLLKSIELLRSTGGNL